MFASTFEKQLDLKRRFVVPAEFRALVSGPFDGIICFPSFEADCIEGGGKALFDRHMAMIEELDFADPLRTAIETEVLGGQVRMTFDTAGRVTVPEALCAQFGLTDQVTLVGLGDRFQIWEPEAFKTHRIAQRTLIRQDLPAFRRAQRAAKIGGVGV